MAEFAVREPFPGVFHIRDPLGVCMTLLTGSRRALLLDAGYGAGNLRALTEEMTSLPLTLVLSHGHHDHALGSVHFPFSLLRAQDLPVFQTYTGEDQRRRVIRAADLQGPEAEAYLRAAIPLPQPLSADRFDLGGMSAVVIPVPGHTPGSVAIYVPKRRLMLTGDSWNPQTWVFFPEALDIRTYAMSFRAMMAFPFQAALAPHREEPVQRAHLEAFAEGLHETGFASAKPVRVKGYEHLPVRAYEPAPGAWILFRG